MSKKYKDISVIRWVYRSTQVVVWADNEKEALEQVQKMKRTRDSSYSQPLEHLKCQYAMLHPDGKYVQF